MKAANAIIFQTINQGLNVVIFDEMFSFDGFLGFPKSCCGIERAF